MTPPNPCFMSTPAPQKTKSDLEVTIFIIFENSVRTPDCNICVQ